VRVQAGLKSEQLRTALAGVERFKVLEFTTMADTFGGFTKIGAAYARHQRLSDCVHKCRRTCWR